MLDASALVRIKPLAEGEGLSQQPGADLLPYSCTEAHIVMSCKKYFFNILCLGCRQKWATKLSPFHLDYLFTKKLHFPTPDPVVPHLLCSCLLFPSCSQTMFFSACPPFLVILLNFPFFFNICIYLNNLG